MGKESLALSFTHLFSTYYLTPLYQFTMLFVSLLTPQFIFFSKKNFFQKEVIGFFY